MEKQKYLEQYSHLPTYKKVAGMAYDAGKKEGLESNQNDAFRKMHLEFQSTKRKLADKEKELKELWECIHDPEAFANLI